MGADDADILLLARAYLALLSRSQAVEEALREIRDLKPAEFKFPEDWRQQIEGCPECQRYKGHPIQQGICDTHRKPLWARDSHDSHEEKALGYRAMRIARAALEGKAG